MSQSTGRQSILTARLQHGRSGSCSCPARPFQLFQPNGTRPTRVLTPASAGGHESAPCATADSGEMPKPESLSGTPSAASATVAGSQCSAAVSVQILIGLLCHRCGPMMTGPGSLTHRSAQNSRYLIHFPPSVPTAPRPSRFPRSPKE
uniref:Uncharacterized protein n=1 Tax=Anopheles merus TaxID=30066 RepID=A0A182V3D0_ANOME